MNPTPTTPTFLGRFTVLKGGVRELWIILGAKLFAILAYAIMNSTLVLWLSSDLGYNDKDAGNMVLMWSAAMSFVMVFVGSLTDAVGIRKALLLGICTCLFARVVLTFASAKDIALVGGLMPLAVGEALMGPVMVAGIRRYTSSAQRSMAFSLFYAMMNVGFLFASSIFDFLRKNLGEHGHFKFTVMGLNMELSTYRWLFLASLLMTLPNLLLICFCMRPGVDVSDEGAVTIAAVEPKKENAGFFANVGRAIAQAARDTVRIFAGLWRQPSFYKFLAFLAFVQLVRLVIIHTYYTYPKFAIRELGEGAPIGFWTRTNSFLIIIIAPIVGALTQRISAYTMVIIGTIITTLSVYLMVLPPPWVQGLADGWLGDIVVHQWLGVKGPVNPYYILIFLFAIGYSIGESFWSPRSYEYAAAIAPKGQEASYMALSFLPFFLGKMLVGPLSGRLLTRFCPATGERHSDQLWLAIALMTTLGPIGLITLRKYIRVHESGRD